MINTLIFGLPTLEDIQMGALGALRTVLLNLCEAIYKVITFCFNIFLELGQSEILDNKSIQEIYVRVGLILGLFMIFRITFSAIEYLINPDTMLDKQKGIGNIIKKVLIVIILLGNTQFIFRMAYDMQKFIINDDIISKVILGYHDENSINNKSGTMIDSIFRPFYYPTEAYINFDSNKTSSYYNEAGEKIEIKSDDDEKKLADICKYYLDSGTENAKLYQNVRNNDFELAYACLNVKGIQTIEDGEEKQTFLVNYDGFISLAVAIVILYVIIVYTIQVGVRVLQLAYLELIAPIPIMSYLMPNGEEKLKKWGQQCLTTFLDFFIRIAIMYFIIKIITILSNNDSQFFNAFSDNGLVTKGYVTVIMIIALLIFAKKVPELLKEIFPSMGGAAGLSFGIKTPKQAIGDIPFIGGTASKVLGYAGNAGKKAVGFAAKNTVGRAWTATGGRLINRAKANLSASEEARKSRLEYEENRRQVDATHNKYGQYYGTDSSNRDYNKLTGGDQLFAQRWRELDEAKENAKAIAERYGYKSEEYAAQKKLVEKAQENYDRESGRRKDLATRASRLDEYDKYHPEPSSESSSSSRMQTAQHTPSSSVVTEEHVPSRPRTQESPSSQDNIASQHANLVSQYEQETDPARKAQLRQQIDDFERRH